jgi:formylglycine-generating enzyme required for sulfatase activity
MESLRGSRLIERIRGAAREMPGGSYVTYSQSAREIISDVRRFAMTPGPVTVRDFAELLRIVRPVNAVGGVYGLFNPWHEYSRITEEPDGSIQVKTEFDNHPMTLVTFAGAEWFCRLVGGRLPSELQWQWAARGGEAANRFPWGNEPPTPELANFDEHVGSTTPVGSYPPSLLGLYDLAGNVDEWCVDEYNPRSIEAWGRPKHAPGTSYRVVRGGDFRSPTEHLLCSARNRAWPRIGGSGKGFRVTFDLEPTHD